TGPGGENRGRPEGRGPRKEKRFFFRADKDAHAFGLFGAAEQIDDLAPRLEIVEQQAYPLEVGKRLEILEQMRLTAHDQFALFLLATRPARQTLSHDLLGQLVELRLALLERAFDLRLDLIERMAADARIEKITGFGQRRSRQADRNIDDAVLDLAVLADQDHHGALGFEPDEFDMLEPRIGFGREHNASGAAQAGKQARSLGKHRFDRFDLTRSGDLRFNRLAVGLREIANLHQSIDKKPQSDFGRQTARRGVWGINEAELFEIGHDIPHRRRRQGH